MVQIGKLQPRHRFILNPYQDVRFTTCPECEQKSRQRKIPLVIHVDPCNPLALNKTCRYCPRCDLLIAHKDEIEAQLHALFPERKPPLTSKEYLVIGTVDREDWKRGITMGELLDKLHDFKEVLKIKPVGGWQRE
jgi:hypothetical protein